MPNVQAHSRQAQHNRNLLATFDPEQTPYLDWIITITFYTALHRIEAWFATKHQHSVDHSERDDWLSKAKELRRNVWPHYKELEYYSRQARYQCLSFDRKWVQSTLLPHLATIERELDQLMNQQNP